MELDQKQINENPLEGKISRKEALKKVGITALAANSLMFLQTNALACGSAGGCSGSEKSGGDGCAGGGNGMGKGKGNGMGKGKGKGGSSSGTDHVPGANHQPGEGEDHVTGEGEDHIPGGGSKRPEGKGKKPEGEGQHPGETGDETEANHTHPG